MSSSVLSPYVVSDCHAIGDMATTCDCSGGKPGGYKHPGHGYVKTGNEAVVAALNGGTDVNCGCYYKNWLDYALGNKTDGLTSAAVDLAAGRVAFALINGPASWTPKAQPGAICHRFAIDFRLIFDRF